jgi:hypothetical protein
VVPQLRLAETRRTTNVRVRCEAPVRRRFALLPLPWRPSGLLWPPSATDLARAARPPGEPEPRPVPRQAARPLNWLHFLAQPKMVPNRRLDGSVPRSEPRSIHDHPVPEACQSESASVLPSRLSGACGRLRQPTTMSVANQILSCTEPLSTCWDLSSQRSCEPSIAAFCIEGNRCASEARLVPETKPSWRGKCWPTRSPNPRELVLQPLELASVGA